MIRGPSDNSQNSLKCKIGGEVQARAQDVVPFREEQPTLAEKDNRLVLLSVS